MERKRGLRAVTAEEAASLALLAASVAGIVWANSGARGLYLRLLHLPLVVGIGGYRATADMHFAVNEGLMAVFFLQIGLEIRREMIEGDLASARRAAAPLLAALGGMLVPAGIYLALCRRDPSALHGWAIPVATDIAFSLAVVQVLGRRVPAGLRVFLAAIAVADDLYAILVIAVFYAETIRLLWLGLAVLAWLGLLGMNRAGIRSVGPYLTGAVVLWVVMIRSGVHATLAGAAAAFALPMASAGSAGRALERELRPFVAFIVLPLFGLLNAGLHIDAVSSGALFDPVVQGVVLGLVVGKPVGVFGVSFLGSKLGLIRLPGGLRWAPLLGMAMLCGIGFTVSLFIADLSFAGGGREAEVKAAVFAASLVSAAGGAAVLRMAGREAAVPPSPRPSPGGT